MGAAWGVVSGKFIVVPDKGCDRILVFSLDAAGKLKQVADAPARATSGPRHVAFHPNNAFAYVVNELDSTVIAYRFDVASGAIQPFQMVSALADSIGEELGRPFHYYSNKVVQ